MNHIIDAIILFFIFFSFAYSAYFFVNGRRILSINLFATYFFTVALILFIFMFFQKDKLLIYPYFFRIISPLIYLLPPLGYLAYYYFFFPQKKFNKLFLLLLLPCLFQYFENLRFYMSDMDIKIREIKMYLETGNLFKYSPQFIWINPLIHVYLKVFMYFFFSILTILNTIKYLKGRLIYDPWKFKKFTYWVIGMLAFRVVANLFLLNNYILNYRPSTNTNGLEWLLSMDACFGILFLIFNPGILDFHYLIKYENSLETENDKNSNHSDDELFQIQCRSVCNEINQILEKDHYFTKSECTVENIYLQSKIPQRVISFSFRQVYGMSIKDFINKKRVDYLIELYKADDLLKKYSLDYLGELAGFHSRQTLYSCTEKFYGCTPKALFDKVSLQEL